EQRELGGGVEIRRTARSFFVTHLLNSVPRPDGDFMNISCLTGFVVVDRSCVAAAGSRARANRPGSRAGCPNGGLSWCPSVLFQKFVEQIVAGSRRLLVRAPRRRKGWN